MMNVMAEHSIGKDECICMLRSPVGITLDFRDTESEMDPWIQISVATDWDLPV
jgi:hypothetical protein